MCRDVVLRWRGTCDKSVSRRGELAPFSIVSSNKKPRLTVRCDAISRSSSSGISAIKQGSPSSAASILRCGSGVGAGLFSGAIPSLTCGDKIGIRNDSSCVVTRVGKLGFGEASNLRRVVVFDRVRDTERHYDPVSLSPLGDSMAI
jgi:hypothetical protein